MSKTRNERIQRRNTVLFIVLLLLVFCNIFVALYKYLSVQHEAEVMPDPVPKVIVPIEVIHNVQIVPDIPDEVANKEAQMPEFGYDYGYVCAVVASECRGEPYEGQLAVAQCIRTSAERKWLTPEEVVKLPNRYADPCTYASDIELVRDACCDVFVHGISATDEPIEYFYSTVGGFVSEWHENNLEFVMEIGNHRFFKERG
jgi:hypothetical protein